MASKKQPPDPNAAKYLLFIDTNIWLDLYRISTGENLTKTLALISGAQDRLISTAQVQMEFMKNRQTTILEMLKKFNDVQAPPLNLPPIINDSKAVAGVRKLAKDLDRRRRQVADRVGRIMVSPATSDPIFKTFQTLFTDPTDLILSRENDQRLKIRELAQKRWMLGYPPRKTSDTSIGDAINWEWVIECACQTTGYVIIVSRDQDFGKTFGGKGYLNDWLQKEYKERLTERGKRRTKVMLETQLTVALQMMNVQVPQKVIEAEARLVDEDDTLSATASTAEHDRMAASLL